MAGTDTHTHTHGERGQLGGGGMGGIPTQNEYTIYNYNPNLNRLRMGAYGTGKQQSKTRKHGKYIVLEKKKAGLEVHRLVSFRQKEEVIPCRGNEDSLVQ